ncbi:Protein of unknown function [Sporobacter termitidis DSM 10068]|uniref:DUF2812 domain-containing protein n=1 Tax=Sporobacter termitidis DSM 10068 TaxID=1123282 RepID=A0A1M5VFT9_9FIRM|nr:DUF2812 domain-containing protein [Sporobacter termitidis]SHH73783.1 Protein of unknown function [Sporobacter termitidis DSM 10068]
MGSERLYRRLSPVQLYDISGLETWLADMAEKGYFFYEFGWLFWQFTKGAPKTVRYRLEPAGKDDDYPDVEQRQLYMERGWHYIATIRKLYHVFMAEDAAAPELHTDPRIQSYTLNNLNRQMKAFMILFAVIFTLIAGTIVRTAARGSFVSDYILNANAFVFPFLVLWLLLGGLQIVYAARMIKLKKRLRAGIPFEHHKSYKHGMAARIMELTLCCVLVAVWIANLTVDSGLSLNSGRFDDIKPLSELSADIPVLRLSEIEQSADFGADYGSIVSLVGDTYWRGYTLLVPVQYSISQHGGIKDGGNVNMTTYYYRPAFDFLTKPLFDELVKMYCGMNGANKNYEVLDPEALEGAVYAQNLDGQQLVAYKGNQIFVAWYQGDEDLTEKLPLIAEILGG